MLCAVGLISLGKSDFEVIEPFRRNRFFREALDIGKVPSSEWLRQRLGAKGAKLPEPVSELTIAQADSGTAVGSEFQKTGMTNLPQQLESHPDTSVSK